MLDAAPVNDRLAWATSLPRLRGGETDASLLESLTSLKNLLEVGVARARVAPLPACCMTARELVYAGAGAKS